jgi:hypothetical protein
VTSHLPGLPAQRSPRDGFDRVRADVHVHASLPTVQARIADPSTYLAWLPARMTGFSADTEGLSANLRLPGRVEALRLRRDTSDPAAVGYVRDGAGHIESLYWSIHVESRTEVHVTVELAYCPAGGVSGSALEALLYRPHRTQVLRDLLWAMKRDIESSRPSQTEEAAGA